MRREPRTGKLEQSSPVRAEEPLAAEGSGQVIVQCIGVTKRFARNHGLLGTILKKSTPAANAINGVDLSIREREVVGLVGESGSGKSTLGMSMVRLHDITSGKILFEDRDITNTRGTELVAYRRSAQIIFQDPYSSLNPRLTIGQIIEEPLKIHGMKDRAEREAKVIDTLRRVNVDADQYLHSLPHELSGGLRQRIAIARAIVLDPKFIVADEPVSMLDVSVQAGVMRLLSGLARDLGVGILYISHDIATVRYICDRVAVMYKGRIVEHGRTDDVIAAPKHRYTQRLIAAVPSPHPSAGRQRVDASDLSPTQTSGRAHLGGGGPDEDCCTDPLGDLLRVGPDHFAVCPRHDVG